MSERALGVKGGILYRDTEGFISFLRWLRDDDEMMDVDIIDVVEKPWHWHKEWNQYYIEVMK